MFSFISLSFENDEDIPDNITEFLEHEKVRKTIIYMVAGSVKFVEYEADVLEAISSVATSMIFHAVYEFKSFFMINESNLSSYFKEMMEEAELNAELESAYKFMFYSFDDTLNFGSRFAALKLTELANHQWKNHTGDQEPPPEYWSNTMGAFNHFNKASSEVLRAAFKLFVGLGFAYGKYRLSGDILEKVREPDPKWMDLYLDDIKSDVLKLLSEDGDSTEEYDTSAFDSFISDLDTSSLEDDDE